MTGNDGKTWLTKKRSEAAQLIAEDQLTQPEIAAKLEVSLSSIERWVRHPEFQAKMQEIVTATAEALKALGVRLKQNRIDRLQRRLDKMDALIEARAVEMATSKEIAGGETGLLVRDFKGKDADRAVYKFDAGLVKEMREHEKQAAIETGEWTEKQSLEVAGEVAIVKIPPKLSVEEWQRQTSDSE